MMFTEPKIVTSKDLNVRSYVTFYLNKKRIREYNGHNLNLIIHPNRVDSIGERNQLLRKLQFELHKALDAGCYPAEILVPVEESKPVKLSARELLMQALNKKLDSDLSRTYKRNLKNIHRQFTTFLNEEELAGEIDSLSRVQIDKFLSQFNSSGTYYMDKRRDLGVLFSAVGRIIDKPLKAVKESERRRSKAKLHRMYEKEQLRPILNYLKRENSNLYLCCLLTYGSWLRPHEEIRLLTKGHFKNNDTEIHLSGNENKGGKVRVVYVPEYIRRELQPILSRLAFNDNIFTLKPWPFNDAYFNTQWTRAWKRMFKVGLIQKNQTIYSFRHTAAVEVFKRSKDIYLLQKLLGHSTIVVTLKYLRNLGEFNTDELKDAAPTLDL